MRNRFFFALCILSLMSLLMTSAALAAPPAQEGAAPAAEAAAPEMTDEPAGVNAAWKTQVTRPGVYIFYDSNPNRYKLADYPGLFVGGHMSFAWKDIELSKNVYDWTNVDNWIAGEATNGKAVGLEVIAFIGASSYDPLVRGNVAPNYLPKITCQDIDGRYFNVPAYWYSSFQTDYQRLIQKLGERYGSNDSVAWIEVATGVDGENQPVQPNSGNLLETCLSNAGLGQYQWETYMKNIISYYQTAFPNKPVMTQHYPTYVHDSERRTIGEYAGPLGVGFKGNGLKPDINKVTRRDDAASNFYKAYLDDPTISYSTTVPIGFETYKFYLTDPILQYWAMLAGLSLRADYLAMGADTFNDNDPTRWEALRFANRYLGKDANTTPEIWVALRETGYTYYPHKGNYSFFLKQDDNVSGGRTKAASYRSTCSSGCTEYQIETATGVIGGVTMLNGTKEGWITRRTDQAGGNPYMWFKVDDGYINGGTNPISVTVTYFDQGTDTWSLDYDGPAGVSTTAGVVTKGNTNTWRKHIFFIDDARLANGLTGSSDFRINSRGDGDEYIHMVMLAKRSGSPELGVGLKAGANLISVPLAPGSTAIGDVLASITGQYTKVFAFDGATKSWKSYDVSLPAWANTLQNIDITMGFWVYMNSDGLLDSVGGANPSTNIDLKNGANLIGFPRVNAQPIAAALSSIAGKYTKVFEYDAATLGWKSYDVTLPSWANTLTELRPGKAYWIYVNQDCTLTITN